MKRNSKVEAAVRAHPLVESVSDERMPGENATDNQGDGIWAYLVDGHCSGESCACVNTGCVHSVHEWSWSNVLRALRDVRKCSCADCNKTRAAAARDEAGFIVNTKCNARGHHRYGSYGFVCLDCDYTLPVPV
jgi:hypothetical protein